MRRVDTYVDNLRGPHGRHTEFNLVFAGRHAMNEQINKVEFLKSRLIKV